jgi:hypothetical protein
MVKNQYLLLLISETLDWLSGMKIFTKLNLCDAYHRIWICKGNKWKMAFWMCYGHFKYMVLPFGLSNVPATF